MTRPTFSQSLRQYTDRRALTLLLLGLSAGMPIALIFATLSLWLLEAGIERKTVTLFSWAALGYSFKFIWAPLIDTLPLPALNRMGQRRSWLLLSQCLIIAAILLMAATNPAVSGSLNAMAAGAVLLGFSSATQDVVIDAYRIEAAPDDNAMQSVMSSTYTAGYRIGMLVTGAGALFLADAFGSAKEHYLYEAWRNTYWLMAAAMLTGIATTLTMREPERLQGRDHALSAADNLRLLAVFVLSVAAFITVFRFSGSLIDSQIVQPIKDAALAAAKAAQTEPPKQAISPVLSLLLEALRLGISLAAAAASTWLAVRINLLRRETAVRTWVSPLQDFFARYGRRALLLLALIGLYRIADIVAGVVSNVFYADLGFSKTEIGLAVKTFGLITLIIGGFAGGILAQRWRLMTMMMLGAAAAALTNLMFAWLAVRGHDTTLMYSAVALDNFAAGFAGTVFVAFLSSLTNIRFTAVQYALFSSLMTLLPKTLGGYSGAIVESIGYAQFFILTALLGLPIVLLVWLADKQLFGKQ